MYGCSSANWKYVALKMKAMSEHFFTQRLQAPEGSPFKTGELVDVREGDNKYRRAVIVYFHPNESVLVRFFDDDSTRFRGIQEFVKVNSDDKDQNSPEDGSKNLQTSSKVENASGDGSKNLQTSSKVENASRDGSKNLQTSSKVENASGDGSKDVQTASKVENLNIMKSDLNDKDDQKVGKLKRKRSFEKTDLSEDSEMPSLKNHCARS